MGITIHFRGQLPDHRALTAVESAGRAFAGSHHWPYKSIDHTDREGKEYTGTVYYPHKDCEPLYLVFNGTLVVDDFVKTQFAGAGVHVNIIKLLRSVAPHFSSFEVDDEGGYWESSDLSALENLIVSINKRLEQQLLDFPGSVCYVKESNGRITDLYRARTPEAARTLAETFEVSLNSTSPRRRPWWRTLFRH